MRDAKYFQITIHPVTVRLDSNIASSAQGTVCGRFFLTGSHRGIASRAAEVGFEGLPEISHRVLGRRTSLSSGSKLARARLHACSQRHASCPHLKPRLLPSRVIERGEDMRNGSRLVETRGKFGQHLFLSHCWGYQFADGEEKDDRMSCGRVLARLSWKYFAQKKLCVLREKKKKKKSSNRYQVDALNPVGRLVFTSPTAPMETSDMHSSYKADRRQTLPIVHCRRLLGPKRYDRDHICS